MNRSMVDKRPFEIIYGTHLRGIFELRDLSLHDKRSAQGESFVEQIKELNEQVRITLQHQGEKYKERVDKTMRDL